MSENADSLATVFRDRSPVCNYEPSLPFSDESIMTASRVGDTVYLNGDCPSESRLHSIVDMSGAPFAKQFFVCSYNAYKCACSLGAMPSIPHICVNKNCLSAIECLRIASGTGNTVELEEVDLSSLTNLRSLRIEERCFLFTKRFNVHDLRHLKSIRIDRHCCTVNDTLVPGSFLSIKDCSQLESIHIGSMCFYSYSSMELESGWRVEGMTE